MLLKNQPDSSGAGHAPAQADLLFLLADLLRPPAACDAARWPEALEMLEDLLAAAGFAGDATMHDAVSNALLAAGHCDRREWSAEYHRLFEGAMACPPNETAYVRRDKGAIIADVSGFYRAFGMRAEAGEKPDHIVTQLEFVGILLVMHGAAASAEQREVVALALVDFADAHLGEWLGFFAGHLEAASPLPLYRAVATAIRTVWLVLAGTRGLRTSASSDLAPEPDRDEPLECGLGTAQGTVPLTLRGQCVQPTATRVN